MKVVHFLLTAAITIVLVVILNSTMLLPAPLGKLLSPQHGVWQNAEAADENFSAVIAFRQLAGKVNVYLDDRLVPHIFAEQENDAWFVQGYLHAKFRLWQMELQTHAAAGRASEIVGTIALNHDREFRRLGMVYAAENSLKEIENDPYTKSQCDQYTAGVNAYIESLTESQLPIEYKLLGYKPERWSNLKTALFLKYMSYDLAGHDNDFEMTNAKSFFSPQDFAMIYPATQDSLDPIIPNDTGYTKSKLLLQIPKTADSLYFNERGSLQISENKPNKNNGSNNWAVNGRKTKSGAPILCNDPHLGLNLPSLWFEMQISTPSFNAYGATFPGSPAVIIGFNDNCAFGFTNGGRDVRDYYEIKFKDDTRKEYWFNNKWTKTNFRVEKIKIKNEPLYYDTVAYTIFGPVMYDRSFSGNRTQNNKSYAVKWKAHDASNDLKCFTLLNQAKNYTDYTKAINYLHTPGQNCAFASKNGDIAIKTQGKFPAKWKGQGDFVMPGTDSSYMWQGMISQDETPYQYNPERGFISSANQLPVDSSYPYYLGRDYPVYRGIIINRRLSKMNNITPHDMMNLQTDNYDVFAEMAMPVILKNINEYELAAKEKKYFKLLKSWDFRNEINAKGATVFNVLWNYFTNSVWEDEFEKAPKVILIPAKTTLLEGILKDSSFKFLDNIKTTQREKLPDIVTIAFKKAANELVKVEREGKLEWAKYKATSIKHLTKLTAFSRLNLPVGGGSQSINAVKEDHGPSWRMIVSLTSQTEAYGVYPGGQSGNPGSKFYDNFIDTWVSGKYYTLWVMKSKEKNDKRLKWKMTFSKM